jgi:hypothetical protein
MRRPDDHDDTMPPLSIDQHLAPLMEAMWVLGFATGNSCEGGRSTDSGPSLAYVTLRDSDDGERWADEDAELLVRMATGRSDPPGWRFDSDDEGAVVVSFPPDDLPAITARVRDAALAVRLALCTRTDAPSFALLSAWR